MNETEDDRVAEGAAIGEGLANRDQHRLAEILFDVGECRSVVERHLHGGEQDNTDQKDDHYVASLAEKGFHGHSFLLISG